MIRSAPVVAGCMNIEIWSDVVCPWCYIGKRRFEDALGRFAHRDEVEVVWRSFELDPGAPAVRKGDLTGHLAKKYGTDLVGATRAIDHMTAQAADEGLEYHLENARGGNTFDAHRLIHLARERGIQDQVKEAFLRAYHVDGVAIGDPDAIARVGIEAGLDADEVSAVLAGDAFAEAVRADEEEANSLGVSAVPFFVFGRRYGVPGALPADALLRALDQAWQDTRPLTIVGSAASGPGCEDGSCPI